MILFLMLFVSNFLYADVSPQVSHPIFIQHALPRGESPGWTDHKWIQYEFGMSSIWGAPLTMRNKITGEELKYFTDYETQYHAIDFGQSVSDELAFGTELSFVSRGGGVLDQPIDGYHQAIGFERYKRPLFKYDRSENIVSANGYDNQQKGPASGFSSLKLKMKWWLWDWQKKERKDPRTGFAISTQLKIPLGDPYMGFSSGGYDTSVVFHCGRRWSSLAAIWTSLSLTNVQKNEALKGFPRKSSIQSFFIDSEWRLFENWQLLVNLHTYSNPLRGDLLEYIDNEQDPQERNKNKVATSWNALAHWTWYEMFAVRYHWSDQNHVSLFVIEDFTLGNVDGDKDVNYVSNSPDLELVLQARWAL